VPRHPNEGYFIKGCQHGESFLAFFNQSTEHFWACRELKNRINKSIRSGASSWFSARKNEIKCHSIIHLEILSCMVRLKRPPYIKTITKTY
jgi:hypothetical protein